MMHKGVSIQVEEKGTVSGILSVPEDHRAGKGCGVILAHGAGNDLAHPLLVFLSQGLVDAGYVTLRFNFLYKEKGKKAPDTQKTLVRTWHCVYEFLKGHPTCRTETIIAAGKSMGGRVASQMAADGLLPASRLIFLGYPLHGPGKMHVLRDAHLYRIRIPMLFFVGTRDRLCNLARLESVLHRLEVPWRLETVKGGDHSFRLPESAATTPQEVFQRILRCTLDWLTS